MSLPDNYIAMLFKAFLHLICDCKLIAYTCEISLSHFNSPPLCVSAAVLASFAANEPHLYDVTTLTSSKLIN